jgi:hypothetical protein
MPNGIDKLLTRLAASNLMEKNTMIAAIRKRRTDASKGREELVDSQLSYQKGHAFRQEKKDYRLYSRLTLVLAGIVKSPVAGLRDLLQLKNAFDENYGQLDFAKKEYAKYRSCAWGIQKYKEIVLTEALLGGARSIVTPQVAESLCRDAWRTARDVAHQVHEALKGASATTKAQYTRWFGAADRVRYNTVLANMAKLAEAMEASDITLDWEVKDVWATAVPNGIRGNKPLLMGRKFFDDRNSCEDSTDRAFVANWAGMEKRYGEKRELERAKDTTENVKKTTEDRIKDLQKKVGKSAPTAQQAASLAQLNATLTTQMKEQEDAAGKLTKFMGQYGSRKIARYGTILHEMTHWTFSTVDFKGGLVTKSPDGRALERGIEVECYGSGLCARLAETDPANAIRNADSYRIFCEQFGP